MTRSERTLWRRWVERRDGEAFAQLVRRHARFVYDFARRVAGNAADAEDLTQEAYLKLAEAKPDEPDQVGLRAFLGRRVVLGARMLKRAALARRRHESQVLHPGGAGGPEEIARREQAEKALAVLPDGERRAVELRFLHDLSYAEIAAVLGTTEEAARMRVHRGLERMRARFGSSACLAALALFEPPARMLASTAKTALLTGGVVVAQATGKKAAILVGLALLLGLAGTVGVHLATNERSEQPAARAPMTAARTDTVSAAEPVARRYLPPAPPSFRGQVVDSARKPVADATVRALHFAGHHEWIETRTGEDGAFAFDVGDQKGCTIEARHPSYATTVVESAESGIRLVLEPGVPVRVEVRGGGEPIRGARVAATANDAMLLCEPTYRAIGDGVTDSRGVAELRVPGGRWEIWAAATGWAPKLTPPLICAIGQPQDVRLELEPGGLVEGTVRDSGGAAVANARVAVQASPGFRATTTTDLEGNYAVEHVPLVSGPWLVVVADHPDHTATGAGRMWNAADGDRLRFDLVLPETARLHGVVLDARGEPLPDRRIVCGYHGGNFHVLYGFRMDDRWPFACRTDEHGRFEMARLPPGKATLYLLPDFRDSIEVELKAGETLGPVELRLPGVAVRGRVFDADGRPVANASVCPGDVTTDAEGRFALKTRPSEIVVEAQGHAPSLHAVEGDEVEVRLPATAVAGTVVDPGGSGIPGITVTLSTQLRSTVYDTEAHTNELGRFRFRGAGKVTSMYELDVRASALDLVGGRRIVWGPQDDVVLVLAPPEEAERRRVRGTVVDEASRPIDEPVEYRPVDTRTPFQLRSVQRAGQPGGFVCEQLEPIGRMKLVFHARGYLPSEPIEVLFDGLTPVEPLTVRLKRGAEVEVSVCEEDGAPVAGAHVFGYAFGGINGRTDANGHCVLTGLPPGRNRITVSHPYLTGMREEYVEATGGARQRVEFRGKAAGQIVVCVPVDSAELPENLQEIKKEPKAKMLRAKTTLLVRLLDARGAVVREDRIEKWRVVLTKRESQRQFDLAVTAPGTYRIRCELDGVTLPEAEVEVRLRETAVVDLKPAR